MSTPVTCEHGVSYLGHCGPCERQYDTIIVPATVPVRENDRIRAENARLRALARQITATEDVDYGYSRDKVLWFDSEGSFQYVCPFCCGYEVRVTPPEFKHDDDCPIALLREMVNEQPVPDHQHEWWALVPPPQTEAIGPGMISYHAEGGVHVTCRCCGITGEQAMKERVERLEAENAAMREIVTAVANALGGGQTTLYLDVPDEWYEKDTSSLSVPHHEVLYPWYLRDRARKLLNRG